jgi:hypothetical protein
VAERPAQEVFERERREQFEELTLLQTRGSDLCHAFIGPPRARHHLSEGMRHAALRRTEMAWSRRTHVLSGLPRGSVTCSLGHHPVGPDWAIVWTSLPDSLGRRWQHTREVDAELDALRTSAMRVWDLVLDSIDGSSSLAASVSGAVDLLEGRFDAMAANGVRWGPILCWMPSCHISWS